MPTKQETSIAALATLAGIPFPYMGPIVGTLVGSRSSYVKFHTMRALIEQVASSLLAGFLILCSLAYSVYKLKADGVIENGIHLDKIDWISLLVKSAITWLLFALWGVWNTINALRDAWQAYQGKIPTRPKWSERMAMRYSGLSRSLPNG